jgi:hypothetical protein
MSRLVACVGLALLIVGMLAATPQGIFADTGTGGEEPFVDVCPDSSCGGASNTQCNINDNKKNGCLGICCSQTTKVCDCVWTDINPAMGTGTCRCP